MDPIEQYTSLCEESIQTIRNLDDNLPAEIVNSLINKRIASLAEVNIPGIVAVQSSTFNTLGALLRPVNPSFVFPRTAQEKCPTFSGNPLDFDEFVTRFTNTVLEDPAIRTSEKRQKLLDSLNSRCKCIIAACVNNPFSDAQEMLGKLKDNVKITIDGEINRRISSLPRLDHSNIEPWSQLLELTFKINRAQAKSCNVYAIIPLLLSKVPASTCLQLQSCQTFEDLIRFAENNLKFVESQQSHRTTPSIASSLAVLPDRQFQNKPCLLCDSREHTTKRCAKSEQEKKSAVFNKNLCFRCLQKGRHNNQPCPYTSTCDKCRGNHHSAVCGIRFVPSTRNQPQASLAQVMNDSSEDHHENINSLN